MRTETISIFRFDELSADAQAKALDNWREASAWDIAWDDEWRDSMEAFAKVAGITVNDWNVQDASSHYVNWTFDEPYDWRYADGNPYRDMTGLRLRTWLINNWLPLFWKGKFYWKGRANSPSRHSKIIGGYDQCPLTGYCGDCPLIEPILDFVRDGWRDKRTDLEDIISECFHQWGREWGADIEYQQSDEYIRETIEANEYEFYANGTIA